MRYIIPFIFAFLSASLLYADTYTLTGTLNEAYSTTVAGYDSITVSGTATLGASANGSGVTIPWYVPSGATLALTPGATLGSGVLNVQDGGTIKSASSRYTVTNVVNVSGTVTFDSNAPGLNVSGNITGDENSVINRNGGYCMNVTGDNSGFYGTWNINQDFLSVKSQTNAGNGTICINGGGLITTGDLTLMNDFVISKQVANPFAEGASLTLKGKLSGSANLKPNLNHYKATGTINLQGNGSEYTGNWIIDATRKDSTTATHDGIVISSDNQNAVATAADDRFGSGTITVGNGKLAVHSSVSKAYINNNIELKTYTRYAANDTTGTLVSNITPFSFDGKGLFLLGNLTGSAGIQISNTTAPNPGNAKSRLYCFGNNSEFTGDWHVKNAFLVTNSGDVKNKAFGSGTIYLEGGAGIAGWSSTGTADKYKSGSRADAYVYNNIVNSGVNYLVSSGDSTYDETNKTTASPNFQLQLKGNISGDGLLVRKGGGFKCTIAGNNSAYTGDWLLSDDYIYTGNGTATAVGNDKTTHTDLRLGSGTVYFGGGGIQDSGNIFCDVVVNQGKSGNFRNSSMTLHGTVTVDRGTIVDTTNKITLTFAGELQGSGTINSVIATTSGTVIAPGVEGTIYAYDSNYKKIEVTDTSEIGTLKFGKSTTFANGTIFRFDVGQTEKDVISFTESADLSGVTLDLEFADGYDFSGIKYGSTFTLNLFEGDGVITNAPPNVTMTLPEENNLYPTAYFTPVIQDGKLIFYANGDPNALPEPATWALLLLGIILTQGSRFRRGEQSGVC